MAQQFGRSGDQIVTQRDTWESELLGLGRAFVFPCPRVILFVAGNQAQCFLTNGTQYGLLVDDISFPVSDAGVIINYQMILNPDFVDTDAMSVGLPISLNRTRVQGAHIGPSFFSTGAFQNPPIGGTVIWNGNTRISARFVDIPKVLLAIGDSILLAADAGNIVTIAASIKFHHV